MQDGITGVIAMLVFLAFFTGLLMIVALITKKVKESINDQRVGEEARSRLGEARDRLEDLEWDYRWRRVKVTYITVAAIFTCIITVGVFSVDTSRYIYSPYKPNPGGAFIALLVCIGVFWILYMIVLPKLYAYLKKPDPSRK